MKRSILTVAAMLLLTGCGDLPFVQGLANPENTVFDPALVGAWSYDDAVVIVQKADEHSYAISWLATNSTDTPEVVRMEGRLFKLGEQRVLDLTASEPGAFAIACHVFLRVRPDKDNLKVQFIDSKWIREQVKTSGLASFVLDMHPVLTAPASQVEAFLKKFGFDERALDDPIVMRPMKR